MKLSSSTLIILSCIKFLSQVTTVHVFFHTNNACLKFINVYATNLKKRRKLNGKTKRLLKHAEHLDQVWGTYSLSWAAWIIECRWRVKKSTNFNQKLYLYLIMRKSDFSWLAIWVPAYHGDSFRREGNIWCQRYEIFTRATFGSRATASLLLIQIWWGSNRDATRVI